MLVAVDDTPLSDEAVRRSVELARATGARVTFFHASSGDTANSNKAGDLRMLFAKAEAIAGEASVACTSLAVRSDVPYQAILDAAERKGCDLICMASHGPAGVRSLTLGSQTQKVLQHTTIPVLVSAIASNVSAPEHLSPVSVIYGEHRSLAVVIHGLEYLVRDSPERRTMPRFPLLRAMLYYIDAFPEKLHHPKEDAYLFRKLRQRTPEFNDTLDELARQHIEGHKLVSDLGQSLARYEADPAEGLPAFAEAVLRFSELQWQHMKLEQKVVIPAAQKYLTSEDWAEIDGAFAQNGDPRFSSDIDDEFKQLFTEIIEIAPKRIFDGPSRGDG